MTQGGSLTLKSTTVFECQNRFTLKQTNGKNNVRTQAEYERDEVSKFHAQLDAVEKATLQDRRDGLASFQAVLTECPEQLVERIEWLLNGSYGFGAQKMTLEVLKHTRINHAAWLTFVIAALDHGCPRNFTAKAWHSLSVVQQAQLNIAIGEAVSEYLAESGKVEA